MLTYDFILIEGLDKNKGTCLLFTVCYKSIYRPTKIFKINKVELKDTCLNNSKR